MSHAKPDRGGRRDYREVDQGVDRAVAEATRLWMNLAESMDPSPEPTEGNTGYGTVWNHYVAGLATPSVVPDDWINGIARVAWGVIGSRCSTVTVGPEVDTIHFMPGIGRDKAAKNTSLVFLPHHWLDMVRTDATMQACAVCYTLSQVCDFWNGKFDVFAPNLLHKAVLAAEASVEVQRRAHAVEARLLRHLDRCGLLVANEYQANVLAEYREGDDGDMVYEGRPFDFARACAEFRDFYDVPLREPPPCPTIAFGKTDLW